MEFGGRMITGDAGECSAMTHLEQLRSAAIERGIPAEAADRIGRFLRVASWVCNANRYGIGSVERHGGVVGQNSGLPSLPAGTEWPYADISGLGRLPLPFIASIDCAKLPRVDGLELPADGSLLFFLAHEHALDAHDEHEFARVVHIPAGTATVRVDQPPPHDDDWFESGFLRPSPTSSLWFSRRCRAGSTNPRTSSSSRTSSSCRLATPPTSKISAPCSRSSGRR
jgi:hypothetical protein